MSSRGARSSALLAGALAATVVLAVQDRLSELQDRFDKETDAVHKAKILEKLSEAEFEKTRDAGRANDYNTVDATMEKFRDNLRAAFELLKKQHPAAENHPNGYKQAQVVVRKGLREVDETLLVAPEEYRPPLAIVRKDLVEMDDEMLKLLFPRRPTDTPLKPAPPPPANEEKPQ